MKTTFKDLIKLEHLMTEDILRICEKFVCKMYEKKLRIHIYQLMKFDLLSSERKNIICYVTTMLECFKAAYHSNKLSNVNLEEVFR